MTDIRATFPTLDSGTAWAVVARQNLATAIGAGPIVPTETFIRAGPEAGASLAAMLAARLPGQGGLASRFDTSATWRTSPEYVAVVFGLTVAAVVAAVYGALAIFAALLLAGAEQSREAAHLRVMGLSRRENLGLSAMEHGPTAVFVIVAGMALGVGLFAFLQASLGLGPLVGGDIDVGLPVEVIQIAAIFGAIVAVVGIAVGLETAAESIIKPTAALRRGID